MTPPSHLSKTAVLTGHTLNSPVLSGVITVQRYPNQLDNTLSPQASLLSLAVTAYFLQPRAMPPLYSAGCLHGYFHRNSTMHHMQHMGLCGGLLLTASISYVDYNSLVEGLSPPSFKGLPSLLTAIFRQKGRLTKTLNSKQCLFCCSLMQTSLRPSLI